MNGKRKYSYGNLPESGLIIMGLLFFMLQAQAMELSDTLIIGGRVVIIEKEVTYQQPRQEPELPDKEKQSREGHWFGEVHLSAMAGRLGVDASELVTIAEFVNENPSLAFSPGFGVGRKTKLESLSLVYSLQYQFWQKSIGSFEDGALDTNFFALYSPSEGELSQITKTDFGQIGSELDTFALDVTNSKVRFHSFSLSIGLSKAWDINRNWRQSASVFVEPSVILRSSIPNATIINQENLALFSNNNFGDQNVWGVSSKLKYALLRVERGKEQWEVGAFVRLPVRPLGNADLFIYRPFQLGVSGRIYF